ncbi:MAG TPA: Hsp20/alpha crystallin family protein [Sedimenticola sp.]|nr:Hsp20/alpha crystallin family protein [Sedimenticola sp.]
MTTLVPTDPWRLMQEWQKDLDRVFRAPIARDDTQVEGANWIPAVDIKEEDDKYVLHADIPGVKPEEIEVSMDNGVLTIRGERKQESEEEKENYKRIERVHGIFYRRFSLPDDADAEKITAKGENGVLEVTIPKMESQQPRKIEVQS